MFRHIPLCLIAAVALAAPAAAAGNETLLLKMPKGFKVVAEDKTDKDIKTVMVPDGQSASNWTEMVATQVFYNLRDVPPAEYRSRHEKAEAANCPGVTFEKVKDGTENLYPVAVWMQKCPKSSETGKPQVSWLKAVQGRDSFYLVQRAFGFEPSAKQIKASTAFIDAAKVCDTRVPGQRCPPGK